MARCGCGFTRGGKITSQCDRHRRAKSAAKAARTRKRNSKAVKA